MDSNLGIKKKSFSLYYNGGEIWAEHLDTINNIEDMKKKFDEDMLTIARPSTSAYVAIAVAQSAIDLEFLQYILCLLYTSPSPRDRTRSRMPSSA